MIRPVTRTVFHCKCDRPECGWEWDALAKPKRCAKCKYLSWNSEDRRKAEVDDGKKPPRAPSYKGMLETFNRARSAIRPDQPEVLAEIDRHIAKLKAFTRERESRNGVAAEA